MRKKESSFAETRRKTGISLKVNTIEANEVDCTAGRKNGQEARTNPSQRGSMQKLPGSIRRAFLISHILLVGSLATIAAPQSSRDAAHETARPSPNWLRNGVIYEINPRTFSAAGNFDGITGRLDDLRDLGVTILWLMPIHPVGQRKKKGTLGSPYAVRDYYAINPDYGTKDDLHRLVTEAHRRGLKVIIDIVANHTAWDSVMMQTRFLPARFQRPDRLSLRLDRCRRPRLLAAEAARRHDRHAEILAARIRSGRFSLRCGR